MEIAVSVRGGQAARDAAIGIGSLADSSSLAAADLLVVDDPSLAHGRPWIANARRLGIPTVSVHDDGRAHDADLVVYASLGAGRPATASPVLSGAAFYLLDSRIAATPRPAMKTRLERPRVLVALGGGQHVRWIAQDLADAIVRECPEADILVAAGFAGGKRPPLRHARWLSARRGLVKALRATDVAVVAGGVTLYESCALGVPAVALSVVPEQQRAIRAFARQGAVINAGDASSDRRAIDAAAVAVARLIGSAALRRKASARAQRLVDGRGAVRVAAHVVSLLQNGARLHG